MPTGYIKKLKAVPVNNIKKLRAKPKVEELSEAESNISEDSGKEEL